MKSLLVGILFVDLGEEIFKMCVEEVEVDAVLTFLSLYKKFTCAIHCKVNLDRCIVESILHSKLVTMGSLVFRQTCKTSEGFHPCSIENFLS